MVRWLPRILVLVTLVGTLAMHGVDATATAAHEPDGALATAAHAMHGSKGVASATAATEQSDDATAGGLHHVAVACVFALAAAAVFGVRRLLVRFARNAAAILDVAAAAFAATVQTIWRPPQPVWVRLCVIRR